MNQVDHPLQSWWSYIEFEESVHYSHELFVGLDFHTESLNNLFYDISSHAHIAHRTYHPIIMPFADAVAKIFANVPELQASDDNYVIFTGKISFAAASAGGTTLLTTAPNTDDERALDRAILAAIMHSLHPARDIDM